MAVSIRDIAAELHLSPGTVSAALGEHSTKRRIAARTVELVRRKADEMGYIPNRLAGRIFRRAARKNVGLVLKYDETYGRNMPVLAEALRLLEQRSDCDFTVLYAAGNDLSAAVAQGIGLGVTDFVVIGYLHDAYLSSLRNMPPVALYFSDFYEGEPLESGIRPAASLGFDRRCFNDRIIAVVKAAGRLPVVSDRCGEGRGSLQTVIDYEFRPGMDLFQLGHDLFAPRTAELARAGRCRTLLLHNDRIAAGAIAGLLEQGVRIPDDVAVIAFNDEEFAPWLPVPLTTVKPPVLENVKLLLALILDGTPLPEHPPRPEIRWRKSFPRPDFPSDEMDSFPL